MIIANWKPGAQMPLPRIRLPIPDLRRCQHRWIKLDWDSLAYLGGWRKRCSKCGDYLK